MRRRTLLVALGASTSLAGCVGDQTPGNDDDDGIGTEPGNGDEHTIETLAADCASHEHDWAIAVRDDAILEITGSTPSPTPCYEATLNGVSVEESGVSLTVDVASTLAADEDCVQCAGAVEYEAAIEVGDVAIEDVSVDHARGQTHDLDPYAQDDSPAVVSREIETTDTDCGSEDDDRVEGTVSGPYLYLEGTIPASNPCHRVVLADSYVEEDRLVVKLVLESDLEEGEPCVECVGRIDYRGRFELTGPLVLNEIVVHHDDVSTHSIDWERESS